MASTNVISKLPNVIVGSDVFTTPMAFEEIHVKKVLATQAQKVATIKAKLNDLKNEKAKLLSSIKLQSKKVELCKEDLQNMLSRVCGMIEAFQLVENALIDVRVKASSKVRHIVGSERAHGMDRTMVDWDVQEA